VTLRLVYLIFRTVVGWLGLASFWPAGRVHPTPRPTGRRRPQLAAGHGPYDEDVGGGVQQRHEIRVELAVAVGSAADQAAVGRRLLRSERAQRGCGVSTAAQLAGQRREDGRWLVRPRPAR
jgi:hypothetical protein